MQQRREDAFASRVPASKNARSMIAGLIKTETEKRFQEAIPTKWLDGLRLLELLRVVPF